ncbi:MAG TPA: TAXI family TRAP transporter solute-binding subunit [Stellaceae bacterium]|nr:TAXI family TRAP transporter solute-binding subunit [Stellaceae bacterium]
MARLRREGGGPARPSKARRTWLFAALLLLISAPGAAAAMEALQFFRIGTAAITGTYFQIGGVLASAISKPPGSRDCSRGGSCGVNGLVAVAQATQGSIQNVLAIASGQLEAGLVQSDVTYWAYSGAIPPAKRCGNGKGEAANRNIGMALLAGHAPLKDLRAIAALYPEDVHVVVRAEGAVRAFRDLKGKRVALGEPESGTLADARLVLEAAGLSECDVKAEYLRLSEAAEALVQGRIDAFFMVGGYPVPAISDVANSTPIRLLPLPRSVGEKLTEKYSFLHLDTIPAGTYPGVEEDVPTLSTTALWIVRAEIDADLIHAITRALWSDATRHLLDGTHPVGKRIRLATALDGITVPLHPGAAQFYREAGVKIPDGL